MFKKEVENFLKKYARVKEVYLEIPPSPDMGDYAFPCFQIAKELKKSPVEIAEELVKKFPERSIFRKVEARGPYINFFIDDGRISDFVIKKIMKEKERYGSFNKTKKTVVVESPSPNTNKPLHLGHLRNMILGMSIANLLRKAGCKVHAVDLINDRGVHICKSMLAYKLWGKNKQPDKKTDHFVGDFYVLFSSKAKQDSSLEDKTRELLVKWEKNDKGAVALWKKMNGWAVRGIYQTYKEFGLKIEKIYRESEHYTKGRDIVLEGLKKNVFEKDKDGSIFIDLTSYGLDKKVLLRGDGTSVYITQDIYLAKKRYEDFKMDRMVYVVGSEQIYHFKVLFKILELLGYGFAKNCYHLAYGMVYLPEGKMKSREGNVVDADNIMADVTDLARKEIKKRFPNLSNKEVEKRAKIIGLGAIKFFLIKYDPLKDFTFNPKESLSFEGETGPYVQYAYARISAILRSSKTLGKADYKVLTHEKEMNLVKLLNEFPLVMEQAANNYKPSLIAHYLIKLAKSLNLFYQECPVLKEETKIKNARLHLIKAVSYVLKEGLGLLDVEVLERM